MRLTILSHAGLAVDSHGKQLLCDPWLIGSCYWRSWWNYPPVAPALIQSLHPNWIYLTHIHWDHFQGASLKLFSLDTPILIPYDRYTRIADDLWRLGFRTIIELKHGRRHVLTDDVAVTSYQFSPFTDSALVIEAEGVTILNVNDAKFMGGPLAQILRRHPTIDFALRSHSSANARATYRCLDAPLAAIDDQAAYAQAFCAFMERVQPRFAVPFASNHCHLHQDSWEYNRHITVPDDVAQAMAAYQSSRPFPTQLKIMISGDYWDSNDGFSVTPSPWLADRAGHLQAYAEQKRDSLERTYRKEERVRISETVATRQLMDFVRAVPWFWRWRFRGHPVLFDVRAGAIGRQGFVVDLYGKRVAILDPEQADPLMMRIVIPAAVFKMALALNIFAHAAISKRLRYHAIEADLSRLSLFEGLLSWYEMSAIPLSRLVTWRFVRCYLRRWREVLLLCRMALARLGGVSLRQQELMMLRRSEKS